MCDSVLDRIIGVFCGADPKSRKHVQLMQALSARVKEGSQVCAQIEADVQML